MLHEQRFNLTQPRSGGDVTGQDDEHCLAQAKVIIGLERPNLRIDQRKVGAYENIEDQKAFATPCSQAMK